MWQLKCTLLSLLVVQYAITLSPHPGAMIRISSQALTDQVHGLLAAVEAVGRTFYYPDTGRIKIPHVHGFSVRALEIQVTDFRLNKDKAVISIGDQNDVYFAVNDITLGAKFHYRIRENAFIPATFAGDCWAQASDTSVSARLRIENHNGRPFFTILDDDFKVESITWKCKGKMVGWILNQIRGSLKPTIRKAVNKQGGKALHQLLVQLSDDLQKMKIESGLKTPGFYVNFGLIDQPKLSPSHLQIPITGQFWFDGHKDDNPPTVFPSKDPFPMEPPHRGFCLNIDSNLAFRSAVYAFNVSDKAVFRIDKPIFGKLAPDRRMFMDCNCQGQNCLVSMVPQLKNKCPQGKSIWIHGVLQIGADLLATSSGLIFYASGNGNFSIDLGDDSESEANPLTLLSMKADMGVLIDKNVRISNWTVRGKSNIFYTHLEASTIFGDIIPKAVLESIWSFALKDVAEIIANGVLDNGVPLPPIDFIAFQNPEIKFNGPLVEFCSDFNVDFMKILKPKKLAEERMERFLEQRTRKYRKYLRKVYRLDAMEPYDEL